MSKGKLKETTEAALIEMLKAVNGMTFISIDTEVVPEMNSTMGKGTNLKNPHYGRVVKRQTGSVVMVFQNKTVNGYEQMVQRRLAAEGKDPFDFELSPRKWGKRLPNLPIVQNGDEYFLEVIFLKPGKVEWVLDGEVVPEERIIGVRRYGKPEQGGLDNKVQLRAFSFTSLRRIKIDGNTYLLKGRISGLSSFSSCLFP